MQKGMNEYMEWQNQAILRYSDYCEARRKKESNDAIDYAHERYHFAKVKMNQIKEQNKLVFAGM